MGERVGNKREVCWDAFILQRGRYTSGLLLADR